MELKQYQVLDTVLAGWKMGCKFQKHPYLYYFLLRYFAHPLQFEKQVKWNGKFGIYLSPRFALLTAGGGLSSPEELKSSGHALKAMIESVSGALNAARNNKPVIWFDYTVPSVLIKAFEVESICTSMFAKIVNILEPYGTKVHLEAAENEGITSDMCSMTRIPIGAYILKQLPEPFALISTGHPCDSGRSSNQILDYISGKNVPVFSADTSYERDAHAIDNYTQSIWGMVRFLEKLLNKKMNWDKLRSLVEELNRFNHYLREVTELHRSVPSPGLGWISLEAIWPLRLFGVGSPHASEFAKELYQISKDRVTKKKGKQAKKEKIRVIITGPPVYFTDFYRWMEKEFGAYVVADYLVQTVHPEIDTSSEEAIIRGIAIDNINLGMTRQSHGPVELIIDDLEGIIDAYSADCIISFGNVACKHKNGVPEIFRAVCRKSGLPHLLMATDLFDERENSEEEIKKQISEFFKNSGLTK